MKNIVACLLFLGLASSGAKADGLQSQLDGAVSNATRIVVGLAAEVDQRTRENAALRAQIEALTKERDALKAKLPANSPK
jgi:cell division protein FtsB